MEPYDTVGAWLGDSVSDCHCVGDMIVAQTSLQAAESGFAAGRFGWEDLVAELTTRLSAAEKERDEAIAWGEKLKAKLRDAMEWNWLDDDIEQHCDIESFRQLLDEPTPADLSHLRQETRREAFREVLTEWEKPWGLAQSPFIDRLRRLAEEQEGKGD